MKMHLESSAQNLISHYGTGVLSVNGQNYHQNILITQNHVVVDWFQGPLATLAKAHFAPLFDNAVQEPPDIILLGTGNRHEFPAFELMNELREHGIALEVMNTRAACRTYSVLVSEYRPVAAALIQIEAHGRGNP